MAKKPPVATAVPAPKVIGYLIKVDAAGEELEDASGNGGIEPFPASLDDIVTEADANNWDTVLVYEIREIGRLPKPKRALEIFE